MCDLWSMANKSFYVVEFWYFTMSKYGKMKEKFTSVSTLTTTTQLGEKKINRIFSILLSLDDKISWKLSRWCHFKDSTENIFANTF